jgi:GR25 family glycosyltransferase involved in LPS biosynthesis
MNDIFSYHLYYISFNKQPELEKKCIDLGFKNVNHFTAIDGKKFDSETLLKNNLITIRAYQDLVYGREQHTGIPSLGAIGCTFSHYNLWKLCVEKNLPYIIVVEEDVDFPDKIKQEDFHKINSILDKENSIYVSCNVSKNPNSHKFMGTHFYIISNGACKELIDNTFPIDIQTDYYMSHMDKTKKVNVEGFKLAGQKLKTTSSIQDVCLKCFLPKSNIFYIFIVVFILILIFVFFKYWKK